MKGHIAYVETIERAMRGEPIRLRIFGVPSSLRDAELDGWEIDRATGTVRVYTEAAVQAFVGAGWDYEGSCDGWRLLRPPARAEAA